jgi:protoporphyrinogen oxidase
VKIYDYIGIGSGIAGLHTAYRLQQQKQKILVLEKESYIGGRMSTKLVNEHFVDFGAKFISGFYSNMLSLTKELGIIPVPMMLTKLGIRRNGNIYTLDASKRFAFLSYKGLSFNAKLRLGFAIIIRLLQFRHLNFYKLQDALYLDNKSVYEDLRFLAGEEGFDYLIEPLSTNIFFYGTKDFSRAPFFSIFSKLFKFKTASFPEGIGQLCQAMANNITLQLNTEVKSVKRTAKGVYITTLRDNKEVIYESKHAILAIPGNRVLDILDNPLPEEKNFFSKVRYSSTVQILCEAKTNLFSEANVIWTIPKEKSNFTSLGIYPYRVSLTGITYFMMALREKSFNKLIEEQRLSLEYLKQLIEEEFPSLTDLKIIDIKVWESAVPKFYPGYLKNLFSFLNRNNSSNGIYYCGDYLENPSTEGALTSSIKLLEKLKATV